MELLYFILGLIFASYISPILDGIGSLFLTWVEVQKATLEKRVIVNLTNALDDEDKNILFEIWKHLAGFPD